jgi:hypothetical protein
MPHRTKQFDCLTAATCGLQQCPVTYFYSRKDASMKAIAGGCLCGSVRYESAGSPFRSTLCHCSSCRRSSGAHALGLVTVARKSFQFTTGAPAEYRSSPPVVRTFCSKCGTPLTYWHEGWPDEIALTVGSLDAPNDAPPTDHTWMSEAISWDQPADELQQYQTDRP